MIAGQESLMACLNSALLAFSAKNPEPGTRHVLDWADWFQARGMALLESAQRYGDGSDEYRHLFEEAARSCYHATDLRLEYSAAQSGHRTPDLPVWIQDGIRAQSQARGQQRAVPLVTTESERRLS